MAPEFDYAGNLIVTTSGSGDAAAEKSTVDKEAVETAESAEETGAAAEAEALTDDAEEEETSEEDTSEQEDGGDDAGGAEKRPKQSKKENARYAAARREAEAKAAQEIERVRREEREKAAADMDAMIAAAGWKNPYTGKTITTKAEFDAWQEQHRAEQRRAVQKEAGLDDAQMQEFIHSLPEVQAAEAAKAEAEARAEALNRELAQARLDRELAQIREIEPGIRSLGDLDKLPEAAEMVALLSDKEHPRTLLQAYQETRGKKIEERKTAAAQQAAVRNAVSKDHLAATKSRGKGSASVPPEVMADYKRLNPGKSEEDIIRHYNRYLNDRK